MLIISKRNRLTAVPFFCFCMRSIFLFAFVLVVAYATAQNYYTDALLYSRNFAGGTARSIGVAGAFGSVGADLGSIHINPAGLGLYRSTDMAVTPGLRLGYNQSSFNGNSTNTSFSNVYFGQAGIAWTLFLKEGSANDELSFNPNKIRSVTIGLNYQRQSFFTRRTEYSATNVGASNATGFANYVNATQSPVNLNNYPPEVVLLRDAGIIYQDTSNGNYLSGVASPVNQYGNMARKGAKDEVSIAVGANVNDKIYFGFGIGIPIVTNLLTSEFSEVNANDSVIHFNSYLFQDDLRASGVGVNASLGFIYRATSWMRVGVAYHLPTFYTLSDEYLLQSQVNFDTAIVTSGVQYAPLRYRFRSPMKGTISMSFYAKQHAFFSVDYEFMNYGAMRYNFGKDYTAYSERTNNFMKTNYTFGHTLRAGVEGAHKWFRVRAGYSFSSSPFKKTYGNATYREAVHSGSIGLGYKGKKFYADLTYTVSATKDVHSLMALADITNKLASHRVLVTLGWRITPRKR